MSSSIKDSIKTNVELCNDQKAWSLLAVTGWMLESQRTGGYCVSAWERDARVSAPLCHTPSCPACYPTDWKRVFDSL